MKAFFPDKSPTALQNRSLRALLLPAISPAPPFALQALFSPLLSSRRPDPSHRHPGKAVRLCPGPSASRGPGPGPPLRYGRDDANQALRDTHQQPACFLQHPPVPAKAGTHGQTARQDLLSHHGDPPLMVSGVKEPRSFRIKAGMIAPQAASPSTAQRSGGPSPALTAGVHVAGRSWALR